MDEEQARGRGRRGGADELRMTDEAWVGSAADLMAGQIIGGKRFGLGPFSRAVSPWLKPEDERNSRLIYDRFSVESNPLEAPSVNHCQDGIVEYI